MSIFDIWSEIFKFIEFLGIVIPLNTIYLIVNIIIPITILFLILFLGKNLIIKQLQKKLNQLK
jgi:hypothetical protein